MTSSKASIAIIGAGPAGLIAAQTLAEKGCAVTIYDQMRSVGRKFLMAGRGGLNLTHSEDLERFCSRYGDKASLIRPYLDAYGPEQLKAWAEDLGQTLFTGSSGRVFPTAMKASPLMRAWLARLEALGVQIRTNARWLGWSGDGAIRFAGAPDARPDATLLALGGGSWARLGSDGAWATLLANRGVNVAPLVASNVGVVLDFDRRFAETFAGAPIKGVQVWCGLAVHRGDLIIKSDGLEGGPIYALGPEIRAALAKGPCGLEIDFRPDMALETLIARLDPPFHGKSVSTILKGRLKLDPASQALMRSGGSVSLPNTAEGLARLIKATVLSIKGLQPIDRAISSAGGVSFDAVDQGLMLKALPGVFVAGEMLDWDAPTGGYLLQASFATGVAAAHGIIGYLQSPRA